MIFTTSDRFDDRVGIDRTDWSISDRTGSSEYALPENRRW